MTLQARTATLADAEAIDQLLQHCAQTYLGRGEGAGEAYERLTRAGSDPVVVLDPDSGPDSGGDGLLAFGHVWPAGPELRCFARVRPGATGRGAGTALLEDLERRAGMLGPATRPLHVTQWAADRAATALLAGRGYRESRYVLRMRGELTADRPAAAPAPDGVRITRFDPERDAGPLFAAWCEAFPGDEVAAETWWRERRDDPAAGYEPALWLVAHRVGGPGPFGAGPFGSSGGLVGFCLGRRRDDQRGGTVGFVSDLGVRPAARGGGLGFALLSRLLTVFAAESLPAATLDIDADNLTSALRLYRKAGLHPEPNYTIWSKVLPATAECSPAEVLAM